MQQHPEVPFIFCEAANNMDSLCFDLRIGFSHLLSQHQQVM